MLDDEWPVDLGYIVCGPCFDRDCGNCIGLTRTRPFCGHRCGFLIHDDLGGLDGALPESDMARPGAE